MWPFGEENFYDCMLESYIPLVNALNELREEGVKANITIGITPILAEQMADAHLQNGFETYINTQINSIRKDIERYSDESCTEPHRQHRLFLANWYLNHYVKIHDDFVHKYQKNIIHAFRDLQNAGCIEITTSGATHGFFPLLGDDANVNAQVKVGVETYKKYFGREPKGFWLPECAYRPSHKARDRRTGELKSHPSTDAFLYENGLEYFFTEFHAIEGGVSTGSRKMIGVYGNIQSIPLPARPQTGLTTYEAYWLKDFPVAVMGRNNRASFQVWSAAHGYPGDGLYREFHRRDTNSGIKYWRLTSKDADLGDKMLYDPILALDKTKENADHFVTLVYHMLKDQYEATGKYGLAMVSFDTELYGHWWFEGVTWLKHVIRMFNANEGVDIQTAGNYLKEHPPTAAISLPESTWGQGGHYWVWNNPDTEWMWPIIHIAEQRFDDLVRKYETNPPDALTHRLLNQAARELLLLESSDWPFLVTTFQARDYAVERFTGHQKNFWDLVNMLETGNINEALLSELEERDNPFSGIDYQWFAYEDKWNHIADLQPA
jgi:1,4-alpha-glucan branching enzyme